MHVWEHLEQAFPLVIVRHGIISQLDVGVNVRGGCGVNMVQCSFGHGVENFEEVRGLDFLLVLEEVVEDDVIHWSEETLF